MWVTFARSALYFVGLVFLMWLTFQVLDPMIQFGLAGPHSGDATVQESSSYLEALTVQNLTVIAGVATGAWLLGRAAVQSNLR